MVVGPRKREKLYPNNALRIGWWTVSLGLTPRLAESFPGSRHTAPGKRRLVWHALVVYP